jgi:hypothetical protein
MAEMGRRDQSCAIINAGDQLRAGAGAEQRLKSWQVILYRRNGYSVIALIVEEVRIGPGGDQRLRGSAMPLEGRNMKGRPSIAVAAVQVGACPRQPPNFTHVSAGCRGMEATIRGEFG